MSSFEDEEEIYAKEEIEYSESRVNKYNNYYTPKKNFKKENDENLILSMKNITKRVSHPTFGIGFVVKTEGNKVTIAFKEAGIKTIISDFIKIID
jgi:hypothetical protein